MPNFDENPSAALTKEFLARVFAKMGLTSPKITSPEMPATEPGQSRLYRGELPGEKSKPPGSMWTNSLPTAIRYKESMPGQGVVSAVDVPDEVYQKSMMKGRQESGRQAVMATPQNPDVRPYDEPIEDHPGSAAAKTGFLAHAHASGKQQIIPLLFAAGLVDELGNWTAKASPQIRAQFDPQNTDLQHAIPEDAGIRGPLAQGEKVNVVDKSPTIQADIARAGNGVGALLPTQVIGMLTSPKIGAVGKLLTRATGGAIAAGAGMDLANHSYGGNPDLLMNSDLIAEMKRNGIPVDPEDEKIALASQQQQGHYHMPPAGVTARDVFAALAGIGGGEALIKYLHKSGPILQGEFTEGPQNESAPIDVDSTPVGGPKPKTPIGFLQEGNPPFAGSGGGPIETGPSGLPQNPMLTAGTPFNMPPGGRTEQFLQRLISAGKPPIITPPPEIPQGKVWGTNPKRFPGTPARKGVRATKPFFGGESE